MEFDDEDGVPGSHIYVDAKECGEAPVGDRVATTIYKLKDEYDPSDPGVPITLQCYMRCVFSGGASEGHREYHNQRQG